MTRRPSVPTVLGVPTALGARTGRWGRRGRHGALATVLTLLVAGLVGGGVLPTSPAAALVRPGPVVFVAPDPGSVGATTEPADGPAPSPSVQPTDDAELLPPEPGPGEPGESADPGSEAPVTEGATPEPTVEPTVPAAVPERPVRPATPPAARAADTPILSLVLALLAVALGTVLMVALTARRRTGTGTSAGAGPGADGAGPPPAPDGPAGAPTTAGRPSASPAQVLALLVAVGEAMIDAGHAVTTVRDTLADLAHAHGYPAVETVVLPTALLVSVPHDGPEGPHDTVVTAAVSSGRRPLMLHQVDALADAVTAAVHDHTPPDAVLARVLAIRATPGPFGTVQRLVGYVLLCTGLAALLQGSWADVALAAVAGAGVGAVLLTARRLPDELEVVLTVGMAFAVSLVVFLLARTVPELGVLPSVVAPLVLFLPGGLLTTGVIELSTGQMLSGAGRVAAGTMQLVLLALGIVAAGSLVGLPSIELSGGQLPLGPLAPWIGVVLFGVGTVVFRCGRPASIGWVLLVLSVAYGAQVLGDALLGGVLSAFVGALAMTPVALAVARFPSGPSPLVSFLPAFWMLVPGALGLVGVTTLLDGDSSGFTTLMTTAETMVAIALGVLLGLMLGRYGPTLRRVRRAD